MILGRLEFEFSDATIKIKKRRDDTWYTKITKCTIRNDNVLRIEVSGRASNESLDLNSRHFQELNLWLNQIPETCNNNESLKLLKKTINEYKDENKCYVYIICDSNTKNLTYVGSIYVGYSNDPKSKSYYWGSSEVYNPDLGHKKFIIIEDLFNTDAKKVENYLIKDLKEKDYNVLNRTPPGNPILSDKLLCEIYKDKYVGYEYFNWDKITEVEEEIEWFKSDFSDYEEESSIREYINQIEEWTGVSIRSQEQIIQIINEKINDAFIEILNEDKINIDITDNSENTHEMGKIIWSYYNLNQIDNLLLILSDYCIDDSMSGNSFVKLSLIHHGKEVKEASIEYLNGEYEEEDIGYFLPVTYDELNEEGLQEIVTYIDEYEDIKEIKSQTNTIVNSEEEIICLLRNSINTIFSNFEIPLFQKLNKLEKGTALWTLNVVISDVIVDDNTSGESIVKLSILNNNEEIFSQNITYINGEYEKISFRSYSTVTENKLDASGLEILLDKLNDICNF